LGQKPASRAVRDDPVTEPILPSVEEAPARRWFDVARRISRPGFLRPREEAVQQPDAYLARIASDGEPLAGEIFPVMQAEITFGRDPDLATVVLDDPAIESVHARLWQNGEGIFYLADKDSIAGSWVNYEPVSDGGRQLKHGDVLHIGSIAFRFTLKNPAKMRRPQITPARGKNDTG
jgi:pSer/pThr/pTyr-binding forkhead associated (FHA) protein